MATVNPVGAMSYADIAKMLDDKQRPIKTFIDLCTERNDIMTDMRVRRANNGDTEIVYFRTGLPSADWTRIYGGTKSSKGSMGSTRATCGWLSSKLELASRIVDKARAKGTLDMLLRTEASGHVDALTQKACETLIYGDVRENPDAFNGIAMHYAKHTSNDDKNPAYNVINSGGTSSDDTGSMFLIGWGDQGVYGFYPEDSKSGGVEVERLKEIDLRNADDPSKTYSGFVQYFHLNLGLVVADWRKAGRLCNINRTAHQTKTGDALKEYALKMFRDIDVLTGRVDERGVMQRLYMDNLIWEQIKVCSSSITRGNAIKEEDVNGHKVRSLNGIQVRINEAQKVDEGEIPAFA